MPARFFFPSSASPSCLAAVLRPLCKPHHTERSNGKDALGPEMLEDLVQATMLLHQLVSCFRPDTLYRFEVVATQQ